MAYTPGPWVAKFADGLPNCLDDIVAADGTHVVCFGHDYDEYGFIGSREHQSVAEWDAEKVANARLLAAAPELLEALKSCTDECERLCVGNVVAMRAAIAKAEGT